ncbi:MAG: hypothetical protein U0746_08240 [Gemmataceae bacterium]
MANLRIRDLGKVDPLPAGASLAVDDDSFAQALRVTKSVLVDTVSLVLVPPLITNSPAAATSNSAAIQTALDQYADSANRKAILRLPRGQVWIRTAINVTVNHGMGRGFVPKIAVSPCRKSSVSTKGCAKPFMTSRSLRVGVTCCSL